MFEFQWAYGEAAKALGLSNVPPLVPDESVLNAEWDSNRRCIAVNPAWLQYERATVCSCGGAQRDCSLALPLAVMGHELAHWDLGHGETPVLSRDQLWNEELDADFWAGVAVARAGFTPHDFDHLLCVQEPSLTHPPGFLRSQNFRDGYLTAWRRTHSGV